jgi:hypothetical protein
MFTSLKTTLVLLAALGAPVGYVFYQASVSPDSWTYEGGSPVNWKDDGPGRYHAAPGPVAGAGLPLAVMIGGAYWLWAGRRRRNAR